MYDDPAIGIEWPPLPGDDVFDSGKIAYINPCKSLSRNVAVGLNALTSVSTIMRLPADIFGLSVISISVKALRSIGMS